MNGDDAQHLPVLLRCHAHLLRHTFAVVTLEQLQRGHVAASPGCGTGRPAMPRSGDVAGLLERTGGRYGLQTMCEGGGQANVTIIERL